MDIAVNMREIFRVRPDDNRRAKVSVTIFKKITIHEVMVVQGYDRLFVSMPHSQDKNGKSRDIVVPLGPEIRGKIEREVLSCYQKCLENPDKWLKPAGRDYQPLSQVAVGNNPKILKDICLSLFRATGVRIEINLCKENTDFVGAIQSEAVKILNEIGWIVNQSTRPDSERIFEIDKLLNSIGRNPDSKRLSEKSQAPQ